MSHQRRILTRRERIAECHRTYASAWLKNGVTQPLTRQRQISLERHEVKRRPGQSSRHNSRTMNKNTDSSATIRDYRASIEICRKEFNDINNETTLRGATPAACMGNHSGPAGWEPSPYRIFNEWADTVLKQLIDLKRKGELVGTFDSQASFDQFQRGLVASLDAFWKTRAHEDFPPSRRLLHKLVNLLVKWLRIKVSPDIRPLIERHGHTTLNTPTLGRLGALLEDAALQFPADENFDRWYAETQERIRVFTAEHGGSPIIVDVWSRKSHLGDPDEDA
jgi:hypothetical protein